MANSIVEKLGITPGPWKVAEMSLKIGESERETINDLQCALKAPEMLLIIIGLLESAETNDFIKAGNLFPLMRELIQEIDTQSRTWEELLNA